MPTSYKLMEILRTIISLFAIVFAWLSFYYNYLKGADIVLLKDEFKLPEIKKEKFERKIPPLSLPYGLDANIDFFFYNKGNRAGAVKNIDIKFSPEEKFEAFFDAFSYSSDLSSLTLRDKDAELINMNCRISLNPVMRVKYEQGIKRVSIEADTLRDFLNRLQAQKKGMAEDFVNFLKSHPKLGDITIFYEKTGKKYFLFEDFIPDQKDIDATHSYMQTIEYYEQAVDNYRLYPGPDEIIKNIMRKLQKLRNIFGECLKDFERYQIDEPWGFRKGQRIKDNFIQEKDLHMEVLKKCKKYRDFITTDIMPLLRKIDSHSDKVQDIDSTVIEGKKDSMLKDLMRFRKQMKAEIINVMPKIDNAIQSIQAELE